MLTETPVKDFSNYQTDALNTLSHELHLTQAPELYHAIIGIVTEAVEMLEALRYVDFDPINYAEEIGDCFWYVGVAAAYSGMSPAAIDIDRKYPFKMESAEIREKTAVLREFLDDIFIHAGNLLDMAKKGLYYNRKYEAAEYHQKITDIAATLLCMAQVIEINPRSILSVNIAKLKKRFPEKFDSTSANIRDLAAERATLELVSDNRGDVITGGVV